MKEMPGVQSILQSIFQVIRRLMMYTEGHKVGTPPIPRLRLSSSLPISRWTILMRIAYDLCSSLHRPQFGSFMVEPPPASSSLSSQPGTESAPSAKVLPLLQVILTAISGAQPWQHPSPSLSNLRHMCNTQAGSDPAWWIGKIPRGRLRSVSQETKGTLGYVVPGYLIERVLQ